MATRRLSVALAALTTPTFNYNVYLPGMVLNGTLLTATAGELNHTDGVTSNIQTQLNTKATIASPTFTGTVTIPTPFTLGAVSVDTTGTQLNYLKQATGTTGTATTNLVFSASPIFTGLVTIPAYAVGTAGLKIGATQISSSATQLNYLNIATGVTGTGSVVYSASPTFTGTVNMDNANVTGSMYVREFIINRLRYANGGFIVGEGGGKIDSINSAVQGSERLYMEDPEGSSIVPFVANDIVLVQEVDMDRTTVVKKIVRKVSAVQIDGRIDLTTTAGWTPAVDDVGAFEVGDDVVTISGSSLYMSAVDTNNPFLRILNDVDSYTKWNLGDQSCVEVQLGNLASLANYNNGTFTMPAIPGYGLYTDNGFFSGRIYSATGTIGGWTLGATTLTGTNISLSNTGVITAGSGNNVAIMSSANATYRLWIGHATAGSAPFRITKEGVLYATGATISGTITATAGTIGGWSISAAAIYKDDGADSAGMAPGSYPFYAGAVYASKHLAPFRVSTNGYVTAQYLLLTGVSHPALADATIPSVREIDGLVGPSYLAQYNDSTLRCSSTNGFVFPSKASAPGSPTTGQVFFNTTAGTLQVYTGSTWRSL